MTLEQFLNPQFLGAFSLGLLAAYLFYMLLVDNKHSKDTEQALMSHTSTYNSAKKLYTMVEKEMASKLINGSVIKGNDEVVRLTSEVNELEERKNNLIREIAKLEKGDYASIVEEITIIRTEISKVYNSIERELNPTIKLLEKGQTTKAEHSFKSIEFKHKKTLDKTDDLLARKPKFLQ